MIADAEKDMPVTESQNAENLDKITKPSKRGQQKREEEDVMSEVDQEMSGSGVSYQGQENGSENPENESNANEESKEDVSTKQSEQRRHSTRA